jgi:hypothetical protein
MVANKTMADIRELKVHQVSVSLSKKVKDIPVLPGTEVVQQQDTQLLLKVQGDINPVLQFLATQAVRDIEITHLPLEEVFMSYYRQEPQA